MGWPKRTLFFASSIMFLLLTSSGPPQVSGLGGVFELRLHSFVNPSGRDGQGECCVSEKRHSGSGSSLSDSTTISDKRAGVCVGECSTKFRICVQHYQVTIDTAGPCYFGETFTETHPHSNNLTSQAQRVFHFPFNFKWLRWFSLIIEAWHQNQNASERLITRMAIQQSLEVGDNWTARNWTGNEGQTGLTFDYRVRCLPDYYGDACDKTCRARDDHFGHYTCSGTGEITCLPGWVGSYCEKAVCLSGCHETHGSCSRPDECICHPGWEGKFCSECLRYPGCKHGRCTVPFECECEEGWGGLFCNQDLNYCTNHKPCKNGGTCFNTGQGSYTCSCPDGFVGEDCQFRENGCTCINGGSCRDNGTATFCQCPDGWAGASCETLSLSCSDNPCMNGGICSDTAQLSCQCPPGFGGMFCDSPISKVTTNDCNCQNGGSCTSSGACLCPSGATGDRCEHRVDKCASVSCENGGTCTSYLSGVRCQCQLGWTGEKCTVSVDICFTAPCANGGTCTPLPANKYKCDCPPQFGGEDCSENCDCENGGLCISGLSKRCNCPPGFAGPRCQFISNTTTYDTLPLSEAYPTTLAGDRNEDSLSAQHVIFVIIVSVATPLMVVVAVAVVLLLKRRKRDEQRRNDELARIQNEQNTVQCLTKKCIDPHMIVNTLDIPKAKCSNLDLSFNKGGGGDKPQQYPSMKGGGGSSSCLLDKGDLTYIGGRGVSGLLINTSLLGEGGSCYSSPNHYSPKSLHSHHSSSNMMNNLTPQHSPALHNHPHPHHHPHHHHHPHPNGVPHGHAHQQPQQYNSADLPPSSFIKDHNSQNLATEV